MKTFKNGLWNIHKITSSALKTGRYASNRGGQVGTILGLLAKTIRLMLSSI